jgi:hypothetical protein
LGANYRFRAYALNVESAARETTATATVRNDSTLSFLLYAAPGAAVSADAGTGSASSTALPTAAPPPARDSGGGFVRLEGGTDQRSAVRFYGEPSYRLSELGFRIVKQTAQR